MFDKIKAWFGPEKSPYGTMDMTDVLNIARAGDIILIQEDIDFDHYTRLNA